MATIAEAMTQALQHYHAEAFPLAEGLCRQILQADPFHADALNLMGVIAFRAARYDIARVWLEKAIAMSPGQSPYHMHLGLALMGQGKASEAMACYRQALVLDPKSAQAFNNLGNAHRELGQIEESSRCYDSAVQLQPSFPEAHLNRARNWLLSGNFAQGWVELEWRWQQANTVRRTFTQPYWDSSPLDGRTIYVYSEGGMGDTLQFVRYTSLVKQRGGTVILECQPRLLPLLAKTPGIDRMVGAGSDPPMTDVHAPLLSMPRIFETTLATIPAQVPYLFAEPSLVEQWRRKLEGASGYRIGIAWAGNPAHEKDLQRSIPLALFAELAQLPGVRLFSLQKGHGSEQLPALAGQFPIIDLGSQLDLGEGAFMDTAAVMKNLDLIITSDTSIPHLAGALGVPVWLLVRAIPEWRWLLQREDCPWYPTMRLFRQTSPGDWQGVLNRVVRELKRKLG